MVPVDDDAINKAYISTMTGYKEKADKMVEACKQLMRMQRQLQETRTPDPVRKRPRAQHHTLD